MKRRSIFYSLVFAATAFALLTNCSAKKDEETAAQDGDAGHETEQASVPADSGQAAKPQFDVQEDFQQQLGRVFTSYVELKNAFFSSDVHKVKEEAAHTGEALGKVDMKLLSGAAHHDWMTYLSPIESSLKQIESGNDIETQRKAFSTLSGNLYKSIKAFGLGGKEAYYDFCPMAFNNEGAYWLSDQEEIKNPYFGDAMPGCGQVEEKLK